MKIEVFASPGGSVIPGKLCLETWINPAASWLSTKIDLIIDLTTWVNFRD